MSLHLEREMNRLRKRVLAEAAMVEEAIEKAIRSVSERNPGLASEVIEGDNLIDSKEIEVEEECLKILALHHPVAGDLRFIVTVLKMNNDLERMGDIAVSIARRALYLHEKNAPVELPPNFDEMTGRVRLMVKQALDALINADDQLALKICEADDVIDDMKRDLGRQVRDQMESDPANLRALLKILDLTRHLERIADLATNIAEDVLYLVRGQIVRHVPKE